jgi:predicted nuclease of predicted toxin-antitoxin system
MKLYLDDDSVAALLARLLRQARHDVLLPSDFGLAGAKDPSHLQRAIREQGVLLSHNYEDFKLLHDLLMEGQGHHPGILVVRKDNDPTRDLKPSGIVRAIRNLEAAGVGTADEYIILNHWR